MKTKILTYLFLLTVPLLEVLAAGVQYLSPMAGIPGYTSGGGLQPLFNTLYSLSISVAALLAVLKIVIAGAKWVLSDVVTDKSEAKKDIQGALFGLIVIISAVLIIQTINPNIVN